MAYPTRKYRKGYTIFGMGHLSAHLQNGSWVYLDDKAYHPGFILSMQYRKVLALSDAHRIYEAIDCKDEYYKGEYKRPYPDGIAHETRRMRL